MNPHHQTRGRTGSAKVATVVHYTFAQLPVHEVTLTILLQPACFKQMTNAELGSLE